MTRFRCFTFTPLAMLMAAAWAYEQREASGQIPCRYEVLAEISAPPCGFGNVVTAGTAISPDGHMVVGYAKCPLGNPQPFKWTAATGFQFVPLPPWLTEAMPADVNDHNVMVGTGVGTVAGQRGWMCDLNTGVWTELLPQNPPTGWSGASGINNSNVVCGYRSIADGGDPVNPQTAFIWSAKEGFTDLGLIGGFGTAAHDINDRGQVVIADSVIIGAVAGLWDGKEFVATPRMPDGSLPYPRRLNIHGAVVGTAALGTASSQPFIWQGTDVGLLGTLPNANRGGAAGVNASGTVTGLSTLVTGGQRAYVWQRGVMRDLSTLVFQPGLTLTRGMGISEDGMIISDSSSATCVLLSPVSLALGDTNCDALVNVADLLAVIINWGPCDGCVHDFTNDGMVEYQDLLIVITHWGPTGGAP